MRHPAHYIPALCLIFLLLAVDSPGIEVPYEYPVASVEAAFVYNLTKFVTWPDAAFHNENSPLVLAVFDPQVYSAASQSLAGRRVWERRLEVRKVSGIDEALDAHLLVIGRAEAPRLDQLLAAVAGRPILTVSDIDDFTARGGMLALFTEERKIRFGVRLDIVRKAGLEISSEVLNLASFVRGTAGGEGS